MPRGHKGLTVEQLRDFARDTAAATLKQLRAEILAIERTFPELSESRRRRRLVKTARAKTRTMSAAARKAISARMKKYWTERKKVHKK